METPVDFFGNLYYLLFLQCLRDLNQFACLALLTGYVHVADAVELHDSVPMYVLCENFKCLGLFEEGGKLLRVMAVGNAQKHSAAVSFKFPHIEIAGRRNKRVIVVVGAASKGIVVHIDRSRGADQFRDIGASVPRENGRRFIRLHFLSVERKVFLHDFVHPFTDSRHVIRVCSEAVGLYERAEISL